MKNGKEQKRREAENLLTDEILREALSDANLIRYAAATAEMAEEEKVYSGKYQRKITALLRQKNVRRYARRKSLFSFQRIVTGTACVLAVFLIAGGSILLISPSARAAAVRFLSDLNEKEGFTTYYLEEDETEDFAPGQEKFQRFCESKENSLLLPEGYRKVTSGPEDEGRRFQSWYRNDEGEILLFTILIADENTFVTVPYADMVSEPERVTQDGISADLYLADSKEDISSAVWSDGRTNILYSLDGNLSRDEFLKMIGSVL